METFYHLTGLAFAVATSALVVVLAIQALRTSRNEGES